jgi:membrane protein DedA with SNARE-associated domain
MIALLVFVAAAVLVGYVLPLAPGSLDRVADMLASHWVLVVVALASEVVVTYAVGLRPRRDNRPDKRDDGAAS